MLERSILNSSHFFRFLGYRLAGDASAMAVTDSPLDPLIHITPGHFLASPGLRSGLLRNLAKYLQELDRVGESGALWGEYRGSHVQPLCCLRCRREIESGDKSVAVYMFAQTVGVRPRQKSTAQRICFCPQCAVSLAMGLPPEGALNMVAWEMIRELVSAEPALNEAAWENLRGLVGLLTAGDAGDSARRYRRAGWG